MGERGTFGGWKGSTAAEGPPGRRSFWRGGRSSPREARGLRLSVEHLRLWGRRERPSSEQAALPEGGSAGGGERRRLGGLAPVTEEARDGLGFLDEGDELHASLAGGTRFDVEGEAALEELGPRDVASAGTRGALGLVGGLTVSVRNLGRAKHTRPVFAGGAEDAGVTDGREARSGDRRSQPSRAFSDRSAS